MSRLLKHTIQNIMHLLPDGIAIGFDDHTASHCRVLGKASLNNQIVVPLRVVLVALGQIFQFNCHYILILIICKSTYASVPYIVAKVVKNCEMRNINSPDIVDKRTLSQKSVTTEAKMRATRYDDMVQ